MITLYLIRHGETDFNKPGIYFGNTDADLNGLGIKQCKILAKAMDRIKLDAIISSPLKRCYKTAGYVASKKDLPIDVIDELREMNFGIWEGQHYDEVARLYPEEWKQSNEDWRNTSPTKGESFRQFYDRVLEGLDKTLKHYSDKKVAVITHGGCMRVIVSALLNLKQDGFWNFYFEHGKYSLLEIEEGHCTIKKINSIE